MADKPGPGQNPLREALLAEEKGANVNEHNEEGSGPKKIHAKSHGLSSAQAAVLLQQYGRNELEEKKTPKWLIFVSQLYQPMVVFILLTPSTRMPHGLQYTPLPFS